MKFRASAFRLSGLRGIEIVGLHGLRDLLCLAQLDNLTSCKKASTIVVGLCPFNLGSSLCAP